MPLRAVVFDLFDTLVDLHMDGLPLVTLNGRTFPSTAGVLHAEVARHAPVTLEEFAAAQRAVVQEVMQPRHEAGREFPTRERFDFVLARLGVAHPELAERLTSLHMGLLVGQVRHVAHHGEVLARLASRGVKLGVCSNFSHSQTALAILESARLRWHFDAILVSDTVGFLKPRPEIFRATLGALGSAPEETLHVGDSLSADIAGAAALGMRTAWLTRRVPKTDEALAKHTGPRPDHVVADLAEIAEIAERA